MALKTCMEEASRWYEVSNSFILSYFVPGSVRVH